MSLLQEGAGLVKNHQSTKPFLWALGGYWTLISSRLESGTHRHPHSLFKSTSFTACVTVSGVSGAAADRESRVMNLILYMADQILLYCINNQVSDNYEGEFLHKIILWLRPCTKVITMV